MQVIKSIIELLDYNFPYHLKSTLHVSRRICKDHYILSMARILVQLNANNLNPQ